MRVLPLLALACLGAYFFSKSRRPVPDPDERIRRSVRGLVPEPSDVQVTVSRGIVSLRGTMSRDRRDDLLAAVLATPGVTEVHNLLYSP